MITGLRMSILGFGIILTICTVSPAATLNGTAGNATTSKPAAGDQVILFSLGAGTQEIGRTRTNPTGGFQFEVAETQKSILVRVIHEGVAYQHIVKPGKGAVEIQVYDVDANPGRPAAVWVMQRVQTAGDKLQVIEEITVRNASNPPRTFAGPRPFQIQLSPDADLVAGKVQVGDGEPVVRKPTAEEEKGRYYFPFPLLPGDTRYAVAYRLPYGGEAMIRPSVVGAIKRLVVVLPDTMKFGAKWPGLFQPVSGSAGVNVYGTVAGTSEQLSYVISGMGRLPQAPVLDGGLPQQTPAARSSGSAATAQLPSPIESYRWPLVGGLILVLAAATAGLLVHSRKESRNLSA